MKEPLGSSGLGGWVPVEGAHSTSHLGPDPVLTRTRWSRSVLRPDRPFSPIGGDEGHLSSLDPGKGRSWEYPPPGGPRGLPCSGFDHRPMWSDLSSPTPGPSETPRRPLPPCGIPDGPASRAMTRPGRSGGTRSLFNGSRGLPAGFRTHPRGFEGISGNRPG